MIGIIDYDAGNLFSVQKALVFLGLDNKLVSEPKEMTGLSHLILPGVGSFGSAMASLQASALLDPIKEWWRSQRPFLGICLGMQLLAQGSDESPGIDGLGLISGQAVSLKQGKVPHMGWAALRVVGQEAKARLGLSEGQACYFVHSYAISSPQAAARCDHPDDFAAVMGQGNCWGLQFHPEKSGTEGLMILKKWRETCR